VYLPAIPNKETPEPAQATKDIPIIEVENPIGMMMDNMMRVFEGCMFQLSNMDDSKFRGYQTAGAYAIHAEHPHPQTSVNFPHTNPPIGRTDYRLELYFQQYPRQKLGHCTVL
jgi:hypothetical protein